jgi:hypothetical protein
VPGTPHAAAPRSETPLEWGRDARARAWAFVFQCWQEKQNAAGVSSTNGDDAEERSRNDYSASKKYTR